MLNKWLIPYKITYINDIIKIIVVTMLNPRTLYSHNCPKWPNTELVGVPHAMNSNDFNSVVAALIIHINIACMLKSSSPILKIILYVILPVSALRL